MNRKAITLPEILGILAVLGIAVVILFPTPCRSRENARRSSCQSNLKQVALMLKQYAADFDDKAPPVSTPSGGWRTLLADYGPRVFACPSADSKNAARNDYFFNARLGGRDLKTLPNPVQLVTFGDGPENSADDSHLTKWPRIQKEQEGYWTRHLSGANYAFADGHVKWVRPEAARQEFRFAP